MITFNKLREYKQTPLYRHYINNNFSLIWYKAKERNKPTEIRLRKYQTDCITYFKNICYLKMCEDYKQRTGIERHDYNYNYNWHGHKFTITISTSFEGACIKFNRWNLCTFGEPVDRLIKSNKPITESSCKEIADKLFNSYFWPETEHLSRVQNYLKCNKLEAFTHHRTINKTGTFKSYRSNIYSDDKKNLIVISCEPAPVNIEKCIERRLKKKLNLKIEDCYTVNELLKLLCRPRQNKLTAVCNYDRSWFNDFDGDGDELETEFYDSLRDNVIYFK